MRGRHAVLTRDTTIWQHINMNVTHAIMVGIITYGSLMHPAEIHAVFGEAPDTTIPVKVERFRRNFAQNAVERASKSDSRTAVLTATPDTTEWLNGILVADMDESELTAYKDRESGYELVSVPCSDVTPYDPVNRDRVWPLSDIRIAVGTRWLPDPQPIPEYTSECLTAALMWGDQFATDFLLQTFLK